MGEDRRSRSEELQLRIRETAYLMWEAGGQRHGRSLEYWLAAERELRAVLDATARFAAATPPSAEPAAAPPNADKRAKKKRSAAGD